MSLFSLKHKTPLSFVFDIRDSSVSIAVARFEHDHKPELIVCKNFKIESIDTTNHKKYLTALMETIDISILGAIKDLRKIGNKDKIGKYLFFIGSPWSISTTKIIKIIKDTAFVVNDEFLKKIVTSEEALAGKEIESTQDNKKWEVLEEKIIQSKLNGYKVEKIFNKKANDLEIELFVSFIPSDIKNKIFSFVDTKFGKETLRYSNSTTISSYTFLKDLYQNKNNFIYIDIGRIITDVYVVRDDVVYGIISFPVGEKDILDKGIDKTRMSEGILLSSMSSRDEGHDDMMSKKDTDNLVDSGLKIWLDGLNDAIGKICTELNIPNTVFMITNSSLTNFLVKALTNEKSGEQFRLLGAEMKIEVINEGVLNPLITNGKNFTNEPYIKMDLVFADSIMKQK